MAWEDTTAPRFNGRILTQRDIRDEGGIAPQNKPSGNANPVPVRVPGTATASDFDSLVAAEANEQEG